MTLKKKYPFVLVALMEDDMFDTFIIKVQCIVKENAALKF